MALKVNVMKKEFNVRKDRNQVIWEEFVLKNSIKKKFLPIVAV